jgi:hypothetical protein
MIFFTDSESVSLSDRKIAEDRFARDELDVLETEVLSNLHVESNFYFLF